MRIQNINSNRQSPSRDIAVNFAVTAQLRFVCSGGRLDNGLRSVESVFSGSLLNIEIVVDKDSMIFIKHINISIFLIQSLLRIQVKVFISQAVCVR